MSFRMQFEKVGRGLLRGGKRREGECALWAKAMGVEKRKEYAIMYAAFVFITVIATVFT